MCLTTPMRRAKVAEEDIVCYKLVCRRTRGMALGSYKSYFRKFVYRLGMTYTEDDFRKDVSHTRNFYNEMYEVNFGFHSYINIMYPENSQTLLKCIIPKGSLYYESCPCLFPQYCSNQIKIVAEWRKRKWVENFEQEKEKK